MIREADLKEAIAECQGERNPNANTCMKMAAYYTLLDHMVDETPRTGYSYSEPADVVRYDSGTEFSDTIRGKRTDDVLKVIDEVMETLELLVPKLYYATIDKLHE